MGDLGRYERIIEEEVKKEGVIDEKYLQNNTILKFAYSSDPAVRDRMHEVAEKEEDIKAVYLGSYSRFNLAYVPKLEEEGKKIEKVGFTRVGRVGAQKEMPLHEIVEK